jgi:hypothetical protein
MTKPGFDPLEYLVLRRFPGAKALRVPPSLPPRVDQRYTASLERVMKAQQELHAYEDELKRKTPAELEELCKQEREKEWAERVARASKNEEERSFNRPNAQADFTYWVKAAHWTLDEAIALSFGKAPELVSWDNVKSFVQISPFAFQYQRRRELAVRALKWEQVFDPVLPSIFLAWAKRTELSVPSELEAAVKARGIQIADWKSLYDELKATSDKHHEQWRTVCNEQRDRIQQLLGRIQELETHLASAATAPAPAPENLLSTRERDSLLKLVIGMAVGGYGYDPAAARSPQPSAIEADLAERGISLDVDTIRKWLRQASELLPPQKAE